MLTNSGNIQIASRWCGHEEVHTNSQRYHLFTNLPPSGMFSAEELLVGFPAGMLAVISHE